MKKRAHEGGWMEMMTIQEIRDQQQGTGTTPKKKKRRYKLYIPREGDREFKKRESAEAYQESR